MISLNRLVGLVWVAKHKGYAAAARNFPYPITQPGLFQQVKRLEEELGFSLFIRVAKDQMELTIAGRKLYEYAAPFLEEIEEEIDALRLGVGGVLRIDASALVLRQLLPGWLRRIRAKDAQLEVRVAETQDPDLSRVLEGKVDLLVDFFDQGMPTGVASKIVATAHAFLVVPDETPRPSRLSGKRRTAAEGVVSLRNMGEREFIAYPPGTVHRSLQEEALRIADVRPSRITEVGTADSIVALVAAGIGYTLVPWLDKSGPDVLGTRAYRQRGPQATFPIRCAYRLAAEAEPRMSMLLSTAPKARR